MPVDVVMPRSVYYYSVQMEKMLGEDDDDDEHVRYHVDG
jgi:hypothetical protein